MSEFEADSGLRLEPCDVFLTNDPGFVPEAIRILTQAIGESRTEANHVGIVVKGGTVHSAVIIESMLTVQMHALRRYAAKTDTGVAVFRPINLTDDEKQIIVEKAKSYEGRLYGVPKLITHAMDWVLQGAFVFRRLTQEDDYPICSWVVAHAFSAADKHFGVDPGAASPDDIWDFVTSNPDKYVQVRDLIPIPAEVEEKETASA